DLNRVLNEGEVGRLQVKGETVTSGYYRNLEQTRTSFTPDGWFCTGDLGFLRCGCLTLTGREKDQIIINGVNFHSYEIESIVEETPGVEGSFTAACAVRPPGVQTDQLAIFFHPLTAAPGQEHTLLAEIRRRVGTALGVTPDYLLPVERDQIPKTSIGKIQRTQ